MKLNNHHVSSKTEGHTSLLIGSLITGSIAPAQAAGIQFTQRPILRFFTPQGRHVAPMGVKFGMSPPPRQISPPSVQRQAYRTPKTEIFTQI